MPLLADAVKAMRGNKADEADAVIDALEAERNGATGCEVIQGCRRVPHTRSIINLCMSSKNDTLLVPGKRGAGEALEDGAAEGGEDVGKCVLKIEGDSSSW